MYRIFIVEDDPGIAEGIKRQAEAWGLNGRADLRASGLGLYLCRRVCRKLGHGISAVSAPGEGTEIRIDLSSYDLDPE